MPSPLLRRTCLTALVACSIAAAGARAETWAPVASGLDQSPTPAPAAAAPAAPVRRGDRTYTFQVVLLAADNSTPPVVENVPAKAQKALKDLQDFLPYKSYHLVDMAWLRTAGEASSMVTGPKGETYAIDLEVRPGTPGERILMDFRITQVAMMPPPGASAGSSPAPRAVSKLLSSTFGMELGETVVVGTAKLDNPGRALIVLLSALP